MAYWSASIVDDLSADLYGFLLLDLRWSPHLDKRLQMSITQPLKVRTSGNLSVGEKIAITLNDQQSKREIVYINNHPIVLSARSSSTGWCSALPASATRTTCKRLPGSCAGSSLEGAGKAPPLHPRAFPKGKR